MFTRGNFLLFFFFLLLLLLHLLVILIVLLDFLQQRQCRFVTGTGDGMGSGRGPEMKHPLSTWMVWGRFLIDRYNQMVSFRGRMSCQWGRSWALNQPIRENQQRHPSAGSSGDDSTPYLSVLSWLVHFSSSVGLELTFFFFSRFFLLSSSSCKMQWLARFMSSLGISMSVVLWSAVSPAAFPSKWTRWWRSVPRSE